MLVLFPGDGFQHGTGVGILRQSGELSVFLGRAFFRHHGVIHHGGYVVQQPAPHRVHQTALEQHAFGCGGEHELFFQRTVQRLGMGAELPQMLPLVFAGLTNLDGNRIVRTSLLLQQHQSAGVELNGALFHFTGNEQRLLLRTDLHDDSHPFHGFPMGFPHFENNFPHGAQITEK